MPHLPSIMGGQSVRVSMVSAGQLFGKSPQKVRKVTKLRKFKKSTAKLLQKYNKSTTKIRRKKTIITIFRTLGDFFRTVDRQTPTVRTALRPPIIDGKWGKKSPPCLSLRKFYCEALVGSKSSTRVGLTIKFSLKETKGAFFAPFTIDNGRA